MTDFLQIVKERVVVYTADGENIQSGILPWTITGARRTACEVLVLSRPDSFGYTRPTSSALAATL